MGKKNEILFFSSDLISGFAISMTLISLNWDILQKTQSGLQVSYLTITNIFTSFIISLFGGIIVDRYERKKILSGSYFFSAVTLIVILILMHFFGVQIIYLYLCSIVNGAIWSIYLLNSKSFLQELLNGGDFIKGTSFIEITLQIGTLSAGFFTGILLKYMGISKILFLNVFAFLICSALIRGIHHTSVANTLEKKQVTVHQSFSEGLHYMLSNKTSFVIGIISTIPLVVVALFNVVLPAFVVEGLNGDSFVYGFSDMIYGIGAILAGVLVNCTSRKSKGYKSIYLAFIVAMIIYAPINQLKSIGWFLVCCFLFGIANTYIKIVCNVRLMEYVPPKYMGRFLSTITALSLLMQSVGAITTGYLIDSKGSGYGFFVISIILLVGLIIHLHVELIKDKHSQTEVAE